MILVVDDQEDIRLLLSTLLSQLGHECEQAAGGREALSVLSRRSDTELVILDVQMSDLDGWETLREIRRLDRRLPVLMCTVKSSMLDEEMAFELGSDGIVTKPFAVHDLMDEIQTLLAMAPAQRKAARDVGLQRSRKLLAPSKRIQI